MTWVTDDLTEIHLPRFEADPPGKVWRRTLASRHARQRPSARIGLCQSFLIRSMSLRAEPSSTTGKPLTSRKPSSHRMTLIIERYK